MSAQEHRPRQEARQLIIDALESERSFMTRTEIARAINRAKTPHLIDLIEQLVEEGHLKRQVKVFANGVEGYIYSIADDN